MLSQHRLVRSITAAVCAAAVNGETTFVSVVCVVHVLSLWAPLRLNCPRGSECLEIKRMNLSWLWFTRR